MSFLNPVSLPVKRFSSTDADAPQIDYNARVAGDVKAVLKACLVTGYGTTASAGWSIVNEVDHVAEFVSPSAEMIDYRYKIDDTSTTTTTWSYFYQNTATSIGSIGSVGKTPSSDANKTHASNGWELLVTERGFILINKLYVTKVAGITCHYVYIGQVKSALLSSVNTNNIIFFTFGVLDKSSTFLRDIFNGNVANHYRVGTFNELSWSHVASPIVGSYGDSLNASAVNIFGDIYLVRVKLLASNQFTTDLTAQLTGVGLQTISYSDLSFDVQDVTLNNRELVSTRPGRTSSIEVENYYKPTRARVMIYTDYWEY